MTTLESRNKQPGSVSLELNLKLKLNLELSSGVETKF